MTPVTSSRDTKDSGIPWIGEMPKDWSLRRYKHIFRERDQRSIDGSETLLSVSAYTGVSPRAGNIEDGELEHRAASLEGYKICQKGDLVMNIMLAWNRAQGITLYDGIVSPAYSVFSVIDDSDKRYLDYLVRCDTTTNYFKAWSYGIIESRLRLYPETFGSLSCAMPCKSEQAVIADFLDATTTRIDALVAKKTRLIELLREKRQALITHAVTKGLDRGVAMKDSGVEWFGRIPQDWVVVPFRLAAWFQEGPGIMAADFRNDGVPLLRVAGVQNEFASLVGCNHLDPEKVAKRWNHFKTELGDLLISASATTGTISEVGAETVGCIPYTGIIRLQSTARCHKAFLKMFLGSQAFFEQVTQFKAGSTIQHFGPTHLSQMRIVLPPVETQQQIVAALSKSTARIDTLIAKAERSIELLREHRTALITAAVTGKIDLRKTA